MNYTIPDILCHQCQQPLVAQPGYNWHVGDRFQATCVCTNSSCRQNFNYKPACHITINFPEKEVMFYNFYASQYNKLYYFECDENCTFLRHNGKNIFRINKIYPIDVEQKLQPQIEKILQKLLSLVIFS